MKAKYQFPGGLLLADHKQQSSRIPIRSLAISRQLILPLQQHHGQPATPIVTVGDKVLKGQCIAIANGLHSAPIHAPTSGVIEALATHLSPHPSGLSVPSIFLATDGDDTWRTRQPIADYRREAGDTLQQTIAQAGIVGLGGAGFPSHIKLNPEQMAKIQTVIINGVECEPYISCDDRLMQERAEHILAGAQIIRYILKPQRLIIAIEDNKPDAIKAIQYALSQQRAEKEIELIIVPTRYPSGGEKQLIQILTGQQVPQSGLPIDIGIIMHNVATTYAIANAILEDKPLLSRIVTVTGPAINHAANIEVLFGTPVKDVLAAFETTWQPGQSLIQGGPMMGHQLSDETVPIIKTSNCLLVGTNTDQAHTEAQPCIRCGECATVCPANLLPQQLYWYTRANDLDKAQQYHVADCIECGCCNYVCPSQIPLVQHFKYAKTASQQQQQEQQKANKARLRHDNRQARLTEEKQQKARRQQQRKAALAASKSPSNLPSSRPSS